MGMIIPGFSELGLKILAMGMAGEFSALGLKILRGIKAPSSAVVNTSETTTSLTYVDLTTTTDSVTVIISNVGKALVIISASYSSSILSAGALIAVAVSGATTLAASDNTALGTPQHPSATSVFQGSAAYLYTGLLAGSTTFKMKYKAMVTGTSTFLDRNIIVYPY